MYPCYRPRCLVTAAMKLNRQSGNPPGSASSSAARPTWQERCYQLHYPGPGVGCRCRVVIRKRRVVVEAPEVCVLVNGRDRAGRRRAGNEGSDLTGRRSRLPRLASRTPAGSTRVRRRRRDRRRASCAGRIIARGPDHDLLGHIYLISKREGHESARVRIVRRTPVGCPAV
jgi:hypothetical protein